MKHVIIGDLHGRDIWKEAPMDDQSKFIFLGDYVDSLRKSDQEILENLRDVIAFKARYPWRVVLLTGNLDAQYMYYPHYRCAGFRASAQPALTKLFRANDHHFAYAYQVRNMLFTHAGVTNTWFRQLKCDEVYRRYRYGNKPIADTMNAMRRNAHAPALFTPCRVRTGQDSDGSAV
ncbi:metallophosphoesterase [Mucilaginibacter corticis]|uniref:Metallophosphoesterase n=1 Tax=Mucilaginibacter corticis TaxID=2597670 RepID=A0A556M4U6_9SPHI|nr:metallophosphoesterase [Mucilaginibacter corticis]TSJ34924.1 metallophosphoesterase [Mucilaginibacter corticis]